MVLHRGNCQHFHRTLHAGCDLQSVTVLRRGDDLQQGTVTAFNLFECWRDPTITRTGEMIQGEEQVGSRCTWHIPRSELNRVGITHINPADRIVDAQWGTGTWQAEATTRIDDEVFKQYVTVQCTWVSPATR